MLLGVSVSTGLLPLFYVATAVIGAGTGIGYVTPVKTLMAFFADHKGMASGLAITGFGLAKFIASPVIEWLLANVSLASMFYIMGGVYAVVMVMSSLFLRKSSRRRLNPSSSFCGLLKPRRPLSTCQFSFMR
jgi:OFA family oxalate/formate antiporter-like MFS transporter